MRERMIDERVINERMEDKRTCLSKGFCLYSGAERFSLSLES